MSAPASPRRSSADPPCLVPGCTEPSVRSLAIGEARKVFPSLPDARRAHLCRTHYKEWKKGTRKERELERASW